MVFFSSEQSRHPEVPTTTKKSAFVAIYHAIAGGIATKAHQAYNKAVVDEGASQRQARETKYIIQNAQPVNLIPNHMRCIEAVYRGNQFSDKALARYSKGNTDLIKHEASGGCFVNDFADGDIDAEWSENFDNPNNMAFGMHIENSLIGYMDGFVPPMPNAAQNEHRQHARVVEQYIHRIQGSTAAFDSLSGCPDRMALIGTIAVDKNRVGKKVGHMLMYNFVQTLLKRLPARTDGMPYSVLSYRLNHLYPSGKHDRYDQFNSIFVQNSAGNKFFPRYGFQPAGFHTDTAKRVEQKFEVQWMDELVQLTDMARNARAVLMEIYEKTLDSDGEHHALPEWIASEAEWQELMRKHMPIAQPVG